MMMMTTAIATARSRQLDSLVRQLAVRQLQSQVVRKWNLSIVGVDACIA